MSFPWARFPLYVSQTAVTVTKSLLERYICRMTCFPRLPVAIQPTRRRLFCPSTGTTEGAAAIAAAAERLTKVLRERSLFIGFLSGKQILCTQDSNRPTPAGYY